jgi:hypothetical protein
MSKFNYDLKTFAFKESDLWEHILFIAKENLEVETNAAISVNVAGETRAHCCGRAEALRDLIFTLENERIKALESVKSEFIG